MINNLINLFIPSLGQGTSALLVKSVSTPVAGALLLFGLVGLYFYRSEITGIVGLIGFLFAFFCTVVALMGNVWANLPADLGWALFGVSCLRAGVYPRVAAILLIIGAAITAPFSALIIGGPGSGLAYVGIAAAVVFNLSVAWLGLSLFARGGEEARQPARTG